MSPVDYHGKVAVITGAASGIGRSCALALATRGASVALADINAERLDHAAAGVASLGVAARGYVCDVSSDAHVEQLAADVGRDFGQVDVLMNNAGVAIRGPVEKIAMDDWRWIIEINLFGVVRGTRAFLPGMLERHAGWIINTASVAGLTGSPVGVPYATSKQAVVGFSESVALYARPKGVGVSVLCPGAVSTNLAENLRKVGDDERYWAGVDEMATNAAIPTPESVAELVLTGVDEGRFVITTGPLSPTMRQRADALETNAGARLDRQASP